MAQYSADNRMEIPDPTPVQMPVGYSHPETLQAMIARLVRHESDKAGAQGAETFEEADDFDIDDDSELVSPYQMNQMQEEEPPYAHASNSRKERKSNPDSKSTKDKEKEDKGSQGVENPSKVADKPVETGQ